MTDEWATLRELEVKLRDHINEPRIQHGLMKDLGVWMRVCSSLDAIGDTTVALSAAVESMQKDVNRGDGELYIYVYGVLQALFVQQDALLTLCKELGVPFGVKELSDRYPRLAEIRELRNDATGHPTGRYDGSAHTIARHSLAPNGFLLFSYYEDGERKKREIDLEAVVVDQRRFFSEALKETKQELDTRMQEHKKKHEDVKLSDIFHATWEYYIEKLSETASRRTRAQAMYAQASLDGIQRILLKFREELEKRGASIEAYPGVDMVYQEIEYPLEQIETFLNDLEEGREAQVDHRSVYIFAWYLHKKMRELAQMAEEIDRDYSDLEESS